MVLFKAKGRNKPLSITPEAAEAMAKRPVVRSSPVKADMDKKEIAEFLQSVSGIDYNILDSVINIAPDKPIPIEKQETHAVANPISHLKSFKFLDLTDPTLE